VLNGSILAACHTDGQLILGNARPVGGAGQEGDRTGLRTDPRWVKPRVDTVP
jgi:hypothetical protein